MRRDVTLTLTEGEAEALAGLVKVAWADATYLGDKYFTQSQIDDHMAVVERVEVAGRVALDIKRRKRQARMERGKARLQGRKYAKP